MFEMSRDASHHQLGLLGISPGDACKELFCRGCFENQNLFAIPMGEYFSISGHSKRKGFRF